MTGNAPQQQEIVRDLQETLLRAVLLRQPLPGQSDAVWFPDLAFLLESPVFLVSEANVPLSLRLTDLDRPVQIMSVEKLRAESRQRGDQAYLQFLPVEQSDDGQIQITVEALIVPKESNLQPLGLGGIRVRFRESVQGSWKVIEPPILYGI